LIVVRSHIAFPSPEMMDTREAHGNPFKRRSSPKPRPFSGLPDVAFTFDPDLPGHLVETLSAQRDARVAWEARVASSGRRAPKLLEQLYNKWRRNRGPRRQNPSPRAPWQRLERRCTGNGLLRRPNTGAHRGLGRPHGHTGMTLSALSVQSSTNPGGRQFHYGIREFAMSANLTGQALHGGFRPLGRRSLSSVTTRVGIRLAALSEAAVMFVYTHDSVVLVKTARPTNRSNIDGLRAMPHLHVVRPSDANETLDLVEQS